MSAELIIGSIATGIVASLVTLLIARWQQPKVTAEARKLNVESDAMIVTRLYAEIERLDGEVRALRKQFSDATHAAAKREAELERENGSLRSLVRKLECRIKKMEDIFRVGPISPAMQEMLDELDRKTGGGK